MGPLATTKLSSNGAADKSRLSVVVPCFDEEAGIAATVSALHAALSEGWGGEWEVLVVDDGSRDGSARRIAELARSLPTVRVLRHGHNRGYGAALKTALRHTEARGRSPGPLLGVSSAALAEATRRDPVAIEPRSFRGDLLLLVGRPAEAVQAYERAAAHELRAEILFHQGIALWQLGRQEEGVVQMRRGVALEPRLASALPPAAREPVAEAPVRPLPER